MGQTIYQVRDRDGAVIEQSTCLFDCEEYLQGLTAQGTPACLVSIQTVRTNAPWRASVAASLTRLLAIRRTHRRRT